MLLDLQLALKRAALEQLALQLAFEPSLMPLPTGFETGASVRSTRSTAPGGSDASSRSWSLTGYISI